MNDHAEIKKLLSAFAGGDLDEQENRRIEQHLADCRDCRIELGELQVLMRLLHSTPEVEPPPWMASRIMARLRDKRPESRSWMQRLFFPLHVKLPVEALALLVVCVSGYYLSRNVEKELRQPVTDQQSEVATQPQLPIQDQYGSGRRSRPPGSGEDSSRGGRPEPGPPKVPASQPQPAAPELSVPAPPPISRQESVQPAPAMEGRGAFKAELPTLIPDSLNEMKKTARGAIRDEPASLSPSPARRAAESTVGKAIAVYTLRLNVAGRPDAAGLIRSAAVRSGALVLQETEPFADQIKLRIAAYRVAELYDRMAVIGQIVEFPKIPEHAKELELTIRW